MTRRVLMRAGAWSSPVVAVAAAMPQSAASNLNEFELEIVTPTLPVGENGIVKITFPSSALPIAAGDVTITYRRISGTGGATIGFYPTDCMLPANPDGTTWVYAATATPTLESMMFPRIAAASVWEVELQTPDGTLRGTITAPNP